MSTSSGSDLVACRWALSFQFNLVLNGLGSSSFLGDLDLPGLFLLRSSGASSASSWVVWSPWWLWSGTLSLAFLCGLDWLASALAWSNSFLMAGTYRLGLYVYLRLAGSFSSLYFWKAILFISSSLGSSQWLLTSEAALS